MIQNQQKILVAQIAGNLLASARAAGKGDAFTQGDLVTTCLTDAAALVAYVSDDERFDILMNAAELTLEEIDACEALEPEQEPEQGDSDLPEAFGRLSDALHLGAEGDDSLFGEAVSFDVSRLHLVEKVQGQGQEQEDQRDTLAAQA